MHLRDVARVELGALNYQQVGRIERPARRGHRGVPGHVPDRRRRGRRRPWLRRPCPCRQRRHSPGRHPAGQAARRPDRGWWPRRGPTEGSRGRAGRRALRREPGGPRQGRGDVPAGAHVQATSALFDHANEFDAVVVSTTEHTHAFATLPALQLEQARLLREAAHAQRAARRASIREAAARRKRRHADGHADSRRRQLPPRGRADPVRRDRPGDASATSGSDAPGAGSASEAEATRPGHRVRPEQADGVGSRSRPGSTGTCGSAPRPCGRSTTSTSPVRSGIAGGTSATARCPTSAATGSTCRSGR